MNRIVPDTDVKKCPKCGSGRVITSRWYDDLSYVNINTGEVVEKAWENGVRLDYEFCGEIARVEIKGEVP